MVDTALIPPHGGYRKLKSFRLAQLVYDLTLRFCDRYVNPRSRTQVARASLEELRLDYEDFLRHRGLRHWDSRDPRRQNLVDRRCTTAGEVASWVREVHELGPRGPGGPGQATYAAIAANAALILINVAAALLDRQIASQAAAFEKEGGFTERLYRMRQRSRRPLRPPGPPASTRVPSVPPRVGPALDTEHCPG
jgi:four helix bundle suffix protein